MLSHHLRHFSLEMTKRYVTQDSEVAALWTDVEWGYAGEVASCCSHGERGGMKKLQTSATDLVAETVLKRQSVEERIERRLEVLREWLRDGVPAGESIPRSLKVARLWEDAELGILPIASPNEFTTTHHLHGHLVRDVGGLLTALRKRFDRPSRSSNEGNSAPATKFDRKAFDRQLEATVSQWHTERDQQLHAKRRADAAEARSVMLLEENARKDELIADLRRQLAARDGLRFAE